MGSGSQIHALRRPKKFSDDTTTFLQRATGSDSEAFEHGMRFPAGSDGFIASQSPARQEGESLVSYFACND
jgi:hypothetical protein